MKRLLFVVVALFATMVSVTAQVKIQSPHPDLDIKITRCAYASGTVVIDMVITNFGAEEELRTTKSRISAYDDEGNVYTEDNTKMAFGVTNLKLQTYTFKGIFPQDIPIKFRLQLSKISANASKFALVKIGMNSNGAMALNDDKPIQIRNLEWVK